jgi:hypothetical protein
MATNDPTSSLRKSARQVDVTPEGITDQSCQLSTNVDESSRYARTRAKAREYHPSRPGKAL